VRRRADTAATRHDALERLVGWYLSFGRRATLTAIPHRVTPPVDGIVADAPAERSRAPRRPAPGSKPSGIIAGNGATGEVDDTARFTVWGRARANIIASGF